jgi:hypothetical protein
MRNSFVFYASFERAFDLLYDEEELALMRAIRRYALDGIYPDHLPANCLALFGLIQPQLDASCRRFDAAQKGAKHRWEKQPEPEKEKPAKVIKKEEKTEEPLPVEQNEPQEKPKKKRYGFWQNVYLTKEELQKLSKITLYQDLISKYSEYKSRHIFTPVRDYEAMLYFKKHNEVPAEMFADDGE